MVWCCRTDGCGGLILPPEPCRRQCQTPAAPPGRRLAALGGAGLWAGSRSPVIRLPEPPPPHTHTHTGAAAVGRGCCDQRPAGGGAPPWPRRGQSRPLAALDGRLSRAPLEPGRHPVRDTSRCTQTTVDGSQLLAGFASKLAGRFPGARAGEPARRPENPARHLARGAGVSLAQRAGPRPARGSGSSHRLTLQYPSRRCARERVKQRGQPQSGRARGGRGRPARASLPPPAREGGGGGAAAGPLPGCFGGRGGRAILGRVRLRARAGLPSDSGCHGGPRREAHEKVLNGPEVPSACGPHRRPPARRSDPAGPGPGEGIMASRWRRVTVAMPVTVPRCRRGPRGPGLRWAGRQGATMPPRPPAGRAGPGRATARQTRPETGNAHHQRQ